MKLDRCHISKIMKLGRCHIRKMSQKTDGDRQQPCEPNNEARKMSQKTDGDRQQPCEPNLNMTEKFKCISCYHDNI